MALLKGRTGAETSVLSQDEPGWQLVGEGETIPFVTAYVAPEQNRSSAAIRARASKIANEHAADLPSYVTRWVITCRSGPWSFAA